MYTFHSVILCLSSRSLLEKTIDYSITRHLFRNVFQFILFIIRNKVLLRFYQFKVRKRIQINGYSFSNTRADYEDWLKWKIHLSLIIISETGTIILCNDEVFWFVKTVYFSESSFIISSHSTTRLSFFFLDISTFRRSANIMRLTKYTELFVFFTFRIISALIMSWRNSYISFLIFHSLQLLC